MGYTNYYTQSTDFTDKEWKQIKSEFEYVKDHAGDIIEIQYDEKDYIQFNGTNGCESFCLNKYAKTEKERKYKEEDLEFNFCKTRELPYDIYVWHMLVFIAGLKASQGKKDFTISRDR
jgi:hypothetical protein